jgi:hypothetical protein
VGIVEVVGVVQAKIQTVEDIYRLVRTAVVNRHPVRATYHGRQRWLCPHRLGRNHSGEIRVLCYQYGGESSSGLQAAGSPENWRCIALEKLTRVELLEDAWHTAPNHFRPQTCVTDVDVDAEG